jgi:hypothetical protein
MSIVSKKQAAKSKVVTKKAQDVASTSRHRPKTVLYVSKYPEIQPISITVVGEEIRSQWCEEREYLTWNVPAHLAERFEMHEFFVQSRIIRDKD